MKKKEGQENKKRNDISSSSEIKKQYKMKQTFDDNPIIKKKTNEPKTKEFKQIGIYNEGNTCYMNSALQVLFHNDSFTAQILENNPKRENKIAIEYKNTIKRYLEQTKYAISITSLINTFEYSPKLKKVN